MVPSSFTTAAGILVCVVEGSTGSAALIGPAEQAISTRARDSAIPGESDLRCLMCCIVRKCRATREGNPAYNPAADFESGGGGESTLLGHLSFPSHAGLVS